MLMSTCVMQYKKTEKEMIQPINCATAAGDLRALQSEKASLVTGTEGAKMSVATGEYGKMINQRIAEIKQKCNVQ